MTDRETPNLGGYEWSFECECETIIELAGLHGQQAANLEGRTRSLLDGDEIECPECGRVTTIRFDVEDR